MSVPLQPLAGMCRLNSNALLMPTECAFMLYNANLSAGNASGTVSNLLHCLPVSNA